MQSFLHTCLHTRSIVTRLLFLQPSSNLLHTLDGEVLGRRYFQIWRQQEAWLHKAAKPPCYQSFWCQSVNITVFLACGMNSENGGQSPARNSVCSGNTSMWNGGISLGETRASCSNTGWCDTIIAASCSHRCKEWSFCWFRSYRLQCKPNT